MPNLSTARRTASAKTNNAKTIGQIYKENSDFLMEELWDTDVAAKVCYIYDYYHDDQPFKKDHMTYENTTKTRIDAKFIVKSYQSIDKDQVEYYLQFRPSQPTEFESGDELYYFETDYRQKYGNADFCGFYIDIPNDSGIYEKWIICEKERANQFPKYLILPCTYEFMWIEKNGSEIIKRRMWGAPRSQRSYTIGYYTDRVFTRPDNQQKAFLPMNPITEELWYTDDENKNMRFCISSYTKHPLVWTLSKVENMQPVGLQNLTFYQTVWNESTDYIEKDEYGKTIGLWANYFDSTFEPVDIEKPTTTLPSQLLKIFASTYTLKVGGSYKTLTVNMSDDDTDILDIMSNGDSVLRWTCLIDKEDYTDKVIWRNGNEKNQIKIKFPSDRNVLGKSLNIQCTLINENECIYSLPFSIDLID